VRKEAGLDAMGNRPARSTVTIPTIQSNLPHTHELCTYWFTI